MRNYEIFQIELKNEKQQEILNKLMHISYLNDLYLSILSSFCCNQAHVKELEEEVKLLKDLSHPNIVVSMAFSSIYIKKPITFPTEYIVLFLRDIWARLGRMIL